MVPALKLVRTVIIVFVVGFLLLFLLRLGYGYLVTPNGVPVDAFSGGRVLSQGWTEFASGVKNYATGRRKKSQAVAPAVAPGVGDQKYEKVASVALKSRAFEEDEKRVRTLITKEEALIQFEQREGLKGHRLLRLAIGVAPDRFDPFVDAIQTYGELSALTINKSDKTNEYRELQAKRVSLEKARSALSELKSREGKIGDLVALERQILDLEQQIQTLGVSLGDFDSENEFVTVKMLMREVGAARLRDVPLVRRAVTALMWTAEIYAYIWFGIVCALIAAFIGVHLVRLAIGFARNAEAVAKS